MNHYLPKVVVNYLNEKETILKLESPQFSLDDVETVIRPPEYQEKNAVVVFADVSNFTAITNNLVKYGDKENEKLGTERLSVELNGYMTRIVSAIIGAGGDVLSFAGDAMVAAFLCSRSVKDENTAGAQRELGNLCNVAIQTCMNIQQNRTIADYHFTPGFMPGPNLGPIEETFAQNLALLIPTDVDNFPISKRIKLRVKLGIGLGKINIVHLGGSSDNAMEHRYQYVAVGDALQQSYAAEAHCQPGEIVVSRRVWKNAKKMLNISTGYLARYKQPYNRIKIDSNHNTQYYRIPTNQRVSYRCEEIDKLEYLPVTEKTLMNYIPLSVVPYLEAHQRSVESWGNELRRVSTLFLHLGLSDAQLAAITKSEVNHVRLLQKVFKGVQENVFSYMGTINKFLIDDKGQTVVIVFGLHPFAHDDDCERAVLCAGAILEGMAEEGLKGFIGISTGVSFCGVVGSSSLRREFSCLGDPINMSARLMGQAKKVPLSKDELSIYIDRETRVNLPEELGRQFSKEMVYIKGKPQKVEAYYWETPLDTLTEKISAVLDDDQNLALVYAQMQEKGGRQKSMSQQRFLIPFNVSWTAKKMKEEAIQRALISENPENIDLVWYQNDPETSVMPPIRLNDNEIISNLLVEVDAPLLWFSIEESKHGSSELPLVDPAVYEMKFGSKLQVQESDSVQNSLSVFTALQKIKESSGEHNKLRLVMLEGTYGVGRSYALQHVFNKRKCKDYRVATVVAKKFVDKNDEICEVWKSIIEQLLHMTGAEDPEKTAHQALSRAEKMFINHRFPDNVSRDDKNYHLFQHNKLSLLGNILSRPSRTIRRRRKASKTASKRSKMEEMRWSASAHMIPEKEEFDRALSNGERFALPHQKSYVEDVIHIICGLVAGLVAGSDKPVVLTFDNAENMDPFSWLVMLELSEWWSFVNVTIAMSLRSSIGVEPDAEAVEATLGKSQSHVQDGPMPFSKRSTVGNILNRRETRMAKSIDMRKKTHGHIKTMQEVAGYTVENSYPYLIKVKDSRMLINKLRSADISRVIEVRPEASNTSHLVSNILQAELTEDHAPLIELLEKKAGGMPLVLRDALRYYKDEKVVWVEASTTGGNHIHFDEAKFESTIEYVPPPVEGICGMILDNLSITGQIALKIAAMIHEEYGYFTFQMIEKIFDNHIISTDEMRERLDEEWERDIVTSRTIVAESQPDVDINSGEGIRYRFDFDWLGDCLRKRMLQKQRDTIISLIKKKIHVSA